METIVIIYLNGLFLAPVHHKQFNLCSVECLPVDTKTKKNN